MIGPVGSFLVDGVRHLILRRPTDRYHVADALCGRHWSRQAGYCYVGPPSRDECCGDCLETIEAIAAHIAR